MAHIFITGSTDGLGLLAAKALINRGHQVVLHARNEARAREALQKAPGAAGFLTGDLSNIEDTKRLAAKVNDCGRFDAVIHNAGVYQAPAKDMFIVNTLAPYILTSLISKAGRLIYLSSAMHFSGNAKLSHFDGDFAGINYSDTKLHVLMLAKAVARKWPNVCSNAVNPGWVPTKMGGPGAPDDLQKGYETQVWLATSNDDQAKVSGRYFFHKQQQPCNSLADDIAMQDKFLTLCEGITNIHLI